MMVSAAKCAFRNPFCRRVLIFNNLIVMNLERIFFTFTFKTKKFQMIIIIIFISLRKKQTLIFFVIEFNFIHKRMGLLSNENLIFSKFMLKGQKN